jgi:hypothetical protein
MAKRKKALPARKQRDRSRDDDSVLLRSAESLGRLIGLLQRQLDTATRRLSTDAGRTPVRERAKSRNSATRRTRRKVAKGTTRKKTKNVQRARKKTRR